MQQLAAPVHRRPGGADGGVAQGPDGLARDEVARGEEHGLECEEGHCALGGGSACRARAVAVHVPEVALVEHREQWVHVQEVLLDELVEEGPGRDPETALQLEVVDVLGRDVGDVAEGEEGVE